ncbi:MAG: hypothetical protein WCJ31_09775 [Planctomycetia bacterium]
MASWRERHLPRVGPIPENERSGAGEKSDDHGRRTAPVPGPPKLTSNSKAFLMASDSAGKPGRPLVVESVEVSLNWLGAYQADYPCPRCKAPLTSQGETLMGTDSCPNCKTTVAFAPDVQTAYWLHKEEGERKGADKQRVAEQRRQLAEEKARNTDADRARQIEEERAFVQRSMAEKSVINRGRKQRISARRSSLGGVDLGIGIVSAISFLGSVNLVVAGIMSDERLLGNILVAAGVSSFVSLLLVYGLFRCLFAIHQLLTDISAKLDEDRKTG